MYVFPEGATSRGTESPCLGTPCSAARRPRRLLLLGVAVRAFKTSGDKSSSAESQAAAGAGAGRHVLEVPHVTHIRDQTGIYN